MKITTAALGVLLIAAIAGWTMHVQTIRHYEQHSLNMMAIETLTDQISENISQLTPTQNKDTLVVRWANSVGHDLSDHIGQVINSDQANLVFGVIHGIDRQNGPSTTFSYAIIQCEKLHTDTLKRNIDLAFIRLESRDRYVVLVNDYSEMAQQGGT